MNLALLQQYGSNSWRIHNFLMEQTTKNLDKAVEELKQLTVDVNRERKNFQVRTDFRDFPCFFTYTTCLRPTSELNSPPSRHGGQSSSQAFSKSRWRTSRWR